METVSTKPLSWQKLRHILDAAGVLEAGWRLAAKRDSDMIAVVWFPGTRAPGKRRTDKLVKALTANGIAFREEEASTTGRTTCAAAFGIPKAAPATPATV
jgi:hypothetical protein